MTHKEIKARLMQLRVNEKIKLVGISGGQYDGGVDNDGFKKWFISPSCQMILPGTTLEHIS